MTLFSLRLRGEIPSMRLIDGDFLILRSVACDALGRGENFEVLAMLVGMVRSEVTH